MARRKGDFFLILSAVALGVFGVFILFSLRSGIADTLYESAAKKNPLSEVTVYASSGGLLKIFGGGGPEKTLTPGALAEFKKMPDVRAVYPQLTYGNFASVEISVAGQKLLTDSLIFGVPEEVVKDGIGAEAWGDAAKSAVPVLISRKLIDFYNLSLAPGAGLPELSESTFTGHAIRIFPGYSAFFPNRKEPENAVMGRIVGFSDRVDLVGITIPFETVRRMNAAEGRSEEKYTKVFLRLDSPKNVPEASAALESQGFRVSSLQKEFREVGRSIAYVEIILFIMSGIIIATSLLLIGNSFASSLLARTKEIGIMRAIGAAKAKLAAVFLLEACVLGILGAIFGLLAAVGAVKIFQNALANNFALVSINVESLFALTPALFLLFLLGAPLFSGLAAMIPILKTLQKKPAELI